MATLMTHLLLLVVGAGLAELARYVIRRTGRAALAWVARRRGGRHSRLIPRPHLGRPAGRHIASAAKESA